MALMAEDAAISANQHGLPVTALQINNSRMYIGVVVALSVVSSLMVTTRVVSRWRLTSTLAADEYFIIAAAVSDACLERPWPIPSPLFPVVPIPNVRLRNPYRPSGRS